MLPSFQLKGTDGNVYSPENFSKDNLLVLIYTCNHCPYAQAYVDRIRMLKERFGNDLHVVCINGNDAVRYPEDSFENMPSMAERMGVHPLYLWDEDQSLAKALGAERTPEVFLYNGERNLIYQGAIDDNWKYADQVEEEYLNLAIDAALKGGEVKETNTEAVGCSIKWKE